MDAPTPHALAELARAFVLRRNGDLGVSVRVVIELDANLEYENVHVEIGPSPNHDDDDKPIGYQTNEPPDPKIVEANILEAVRVSDTLLTGKQLAEAAGYIYAGWFRTALSKLITDGKLINRRPGYDFPE